MQMSHGQNPKKMSTFCSQSGCSGVHIFYSFSSSKNQASILHYLKHIHCIYKISFFVGQTIMIVATCWAFTFNLVRFMCKIKTVERDLMPNIIKTNMISNGLSAAHVPSSSKMLKQPLGYVLKWRKVKSQLYHQFPTLYNDVKAGDGTEWAAESL